MRCPPLRTVGLSLTAAGIVLAAWTSISAAVAFAMPTGRSLAVVVPGGDGVRLVVAAGGLPLRADGSVIIARSDDPAFVRQLYGAGALLVLDAEDAGGCSGGPARL
jgi:hypothetical protein